MRGLSLSPPEKLWFELFPSRPQKYSFEARIILTYHCEFVQDIVYTLVRATLLDLFVNWVLAAEAVDGKDLESQQGVINMEWDALMTRGVSASRRIAYGKYVTRLESEPAELARLVGMANERGHVVHTPETLMELLVFCKCAPCQPSVLPTCLDCLVLRSQWLARLGHSRACKSAMLHRFLGNRVFITGSILWCICGTM